MRSVTESEKAGLGFEERGEKENKKRVSWSAHTSLENKAGVVTTPHTVFRREAECDDDETTDDSHFTVGGCKGNTRSHALKNRVRLHHCGWR